MDVLCKTLLILKDLVFVDRISSLNSANDNHVPSCRRLVYETYVVLVNFRL